MAYFYYEVKKSKVKWAKNILTTQCFENPFFCLTDIKLGTLVHPEKLIIPVVYEIKKSKVKAYTDTSLAEDDLLIFKLHVQNGHRMMLSVHHY